MTGFKVNMSPLVNSSINMGNAYRGIGQQLGGAIQNAGEMYAQKQQQEQDLLLQQQSQQQQQGAQAALNDLSSRAMQGDPEAFQQLMTQSPQDAQKVAQYLQQQQQGQNAQDDRFTSKMAQETAGFVEQLHLAPVEQQEAMFNAAVGDDRYDIDEEDRAHFMDPNARKALVSQVKGEDYSNTFFGGGENDFDVQSSKILEDGSIVAISNAGVRQVTSPTGEIITGEAAKEAVKNSNKLSHQRKVELKRLDQTIKKSQLDDSLLNDQQKGIQRSNIQRLSTLSNTSSGRESAIKKATKFKGALSSGEALSGAGRKAATYVPGVFTSQGQFDEEFNAFSEVAARQQLKASGETRPTDADVQGMKQAMFGIGRDEKVNVQLLEDFIADQIKQNEELDQLIGAGHSGDLSNFTYLPGVDDQPKSNDETRAAVNQDNQALQWAQANPNDPRAAQIMQKLQGNQ